MILSDRDIKKKLENGHIRIDPMPNLDIALGPISLDFRLGNQFLIYRRNDQPFIDVQQPETFENLTELISKTRDESFTIHPGEFVLANTLESLEIPNDLAGRLDGKSSLGRLGIVIHSTAGKFDPGFKGNPVLELSNIGPVPVKLYPGMRICQFLFEELSSETSQPYTERKHSKYKFQKNPGGSKITEEKDES
jgi:dCTP deaminase